MRRLLIFLGLLLACAAGKPASAYPLGAKAAVLSAGCGGVTLKLDFIGNTYCVNGARLGSFTAVRGLTVSRNSLETCVWADGRFSIAQANQPCITDLGLAVWEQRTNLFLNSFAPASQTIALSGTGNYTLSVWGGGSVSLAAGTATISNAGSASAGSSRTINCTTTGTITLTVTGSPSAVNFEFGAFGSSPIITTGTTATRLADFIQIGSFSLPTTGTAFAQARGAPTSILFPRLIGDLGSPGATLLHTQSGTSVSIYNGTTAIQTNVTLPAGVPLKAASTWSGVGRSVTANGATPASDANTIGTFTTLTLGAQTGLLNVFNSYIQKIVIWPSAMNIQALTQ